TLFGSGARRPSATTSFRVRVQRGADLEQDVELSIEETFRGAVRTLQLDTETICPECGGRGIRQSQLCNTCRGRGTISDNRRIEVTIPKDMYEGARVRIVGKGEPGLDGGPPGDLYLRMRATRPRVHAGQPKRHTAVPVDLCPALNGESREGPAAQSSH
ncbi:MAG: DnaJ C-terminal domain-containing protein, partial [Chloroflexia bacterium]